MARQVKIVRPPMVGGFSLLEAAVALAILGSVIVGLLLVRNRALRAHSAAAELHTCTRLCASRAAALRAGAIGPGRGDFDEQPGYAWTISPIAPPQDQPDLAAYEVRVTPPSGDEATSAIVILWLMRPAGSAQVRP